MKDLSALELQEIAGGDGEWMWTVGGVVLGGLLVASGIGGVAAVAGAAVFAGYKLAFTGG